MVAVDEVGRDVFWVSGSGPGRKRIRLIRKTPAHLAGYVTHSRPKVWKRLRHVGFHRISDSDHKRRRREQNRDGVIPSQERTGVGLIPGYAVHASRLHVCQLAGSCVHF